MDDWSTWKRLGSHQVPTGDAVDDAALRCPTCRSFDWYRDGFAMHEHDDGVIERQRTTPSADVDTPWSCAQCGYEVPDVSLLRRRLQEMQSVHDE